MPELAEAALMAQEMSEATRKHPLRRILFAGDRPFLKKIIPPPVQKAWPFEPAASLEEAVRILRECQKVAALIFRRRGGLAGNLSFYEAGKVPRILYRGRPLYTRFKLSR